MSQVDLSACESEPIHIPGSIQPHGALLVLSEPSLRLRHVSANAGRLLGVPTERLLGARLDELLDPAAIELLTDNILLRNLDGIPHCLRAVRVRGRPERFEASVHRHAGQLLLELEPGAGHRGDGTEPLYFSLRDVVQTLHGQDTLAAFCEQAVEQLRELSGFDRVMVYRFLPDGTGSVIAEARRGDLPTYLGLHYPAGDIPSQARRLFVRNPLRLIPDLDAVPEPLVPAIDPVSGRPVDLSYCTLRGVSPVHLEYLRNMGVRSSLAVSVSYQGELWGLIACHHQTPRLVDQQTRLSCEFLAHFISTKVVALEQAENQGYHGRLWRSHEAVAGRLQRGGDVAAALFDGDDVAILSGLRVDGAAATLQGRVRTAGLAPPAPQVWALVQWLESRSDDRVFALDRPPAAEETGTAWPPGFCGLLGVRLAPRTHDWLLWFRRELVKTVAWAGNPEKAVEVGEDGTRLGPRRSFARWQQLVTGSSAPWQAEEKRFAEELRLLVAKAILADALAVSRQRNLIMDHSIDVICALDRDQRFVQVSAAARAVWGLEPPALIGQPLATVLQPAHLARARQHLHELEDGEPKVFDLSCRRPDGKGVEVTCAARWSADDRLTFLVARDVTEARHLQGRLQHAQRLESIGQLAGGVAHSFNNLLSVISGYSELLLDELRTQPELHAGAAAINQAAQRGAAVTRQLLAFSRKQVLQVQRVNVNDLIRELLESLPVLIGEQIRVVSALASDVGAVQVDPSQIGQVLMNLAINARDAMPQGGTLTIRTGNFLDAGVGRRWVRVEVTDTGVGMDDHTRGRAFEPFFTTKPVGKGTGLGLAMVHGVVEQSGGRVDLQSAPGQGTSVTIDLPAADAPVGRAGLPTILVVEDDAAVRALMTRFLEREGYRVLPAASVAEAELIAGDARLTLDLLVTDVRMPDGNGWQLREKLVRGRPHLQALVMSGYNEETPPQAAAEHHGASFLSKPFTLSELGVRVRGRLARPAAAAGAGESGGAGL